MNLRSCLLILTCVFCCQTFAVAEDLPPIPPIARVLPPEGIEIPAEVRQRLETRLAATKKRLAGIDRNSRSDVEIFTKAVDLALLHREFYFEKDFAKADWALDQANQRLDDLENGKKPWERATGLVVQGYHSAIDGSAQPYGLVIPQDHDFSKPCPLYVWLHGRGDKSTDLHFLYERATKVGQIAPPGAIVLHPFGRHCVGWKHAGEIDVQEAIVALDNHRLKTDLNRVVLIGFSMGGAGAWHIGAHYTDQFVAVSPGAGFAETARYQNLTPEKYPPSYEQKLWGLYDVPGYVRSLFNTEVIAYSGENDKQIQAARIMEEAYRHEGRELPHLIGPGVEHKYEPKTLEELLGRLAALSAKGRRWHETVRIQTQTLRYSHYEWLMITGLQEHWQDSRADGERLGDNRYRVATRNVASIEIFGSADRDATVEVDGQTVTVPYDSNDPGIRLTLVNKRWEPSPSRRTKLAAPLAKVRELQGPIDDAFMSKFVIVLPQGKSSVPAAQRWTDYELEHFRSRWRALMRGDAPIVMDYEVNSGEYKDANWILWGDAESNVAWKQLNDRLPLTMEKEDWKIGDTRYPRDEFMPALIYPNPTNPGRYIVLNSGLTFREGHDRTNSLQNPKLPDWAIIDITQPPDAFAPGRIHDAGFFDEKWQLKSQPKGP